MAAACVVASFGIIEFIKTVAPCVSIALQIVATAAVWAVNDKKIRREKLVAILVVSMD